MMPHSANESDSRPIDAGLWASWREACQRLGVSVDDGMQERLGRFYTLLTDANRVMNLTRVTAPEEFLDRHLLDSLSLSPFIPGGAHLADIGSGAGFPALPLAVVRPDVTVTAVEATEKKCRFIESVRQALDLPNLSVRRERAEVLGRDAGFRERADVVTARAVAALPILLELCLPLVKVGGVFLAMKGCAYEEELAASDKALQALGGTLKAVHTFEDLRLAGSRLLLLEKTHPTPATYPRSMAGMKAGWKSPRRGGG
jgi:16S rRNA (guanine(527)-N(7))-methyltransferase RsmG